MLALVGKRFYWLWQFVSNIGQHNLANDNSGSSKYPSANKHSDVVFLYRVTWCRIPWYTDSDIKQDISFLFETDLFWTIGETWYKARTIRQPCHIDFHTKVNIIRRCDVAIMDMRSWSFAYSLDHIDKKNDVNQVILMQELHYFNWKIPVFMQIVICSFVYAKNGPLN